MRVIGMIAPTAAVIFAGLLAATEAAQQSAVPVTSDADWPHYNRDAASSRYSPLKQITAAKVPGLKQAWTYGPRSSGVGDRAVPIVNDHAVPIVINDVMYVPAGNLVVALRADTGDEIWRHQLAQGSVSRHGVNYWPGNGALTPRVIFTSGSNLIALNAATGKLETSFGKGGIVDMGVGYIGVPTISRNVIAVGATVKETPQDPAALGNTRAFDARTGAKLWEFHTVPQPGEIGHETWLDDGWKDRSGTNVWGWQMTIDEQLGLLYMPVGGPASNYYGADRPGSNLFGSSIVAVDLQTGKYKWHFQVVHHDLWDYDNPPAPVLLDILQDGRRIPVLAQVGKTGWMFILNRETGASIFGVEERPVPKGDVPGEWYSATQPFPLKPPPLARVSFNKEDMVTAADTNEEHAKNCQALWDRSGGFYSVGPFTPFLYHEDGTPPKSTVVFPGISGGANWGGMAVDPQLGYVFVYTEDQGQVGWTEKKKPGVLYAPGEAQSNLAYSHASVDGPGPFFAFSASAGTSLGILPCQKPPWGRLNAVNANTGEIAWQTTIGIYDGLPEGKRNTGRTSPQLGPGLAGPTATAGGLVFFGALTDNRFRAFDSRTGKELWTFDLGARAAAQPMVYQGANGKQFVAIVAGGAVHAFAIP